jgi:hypothetical protein
VTTFLLAVRIGLMTTVPPTSISAVVNKHARTRRYSVVMSVLVALFFLRVAGQLLVTDGGVSFLSPIEQWQSGLLPYPLLVVAQGAILVLLLVITSSTWRGRGVVTVRRPRLGRLLAWFSYAYGAAMIVRYGITIAIHPEWRWSGHTIPIAFHGVLATYLFLYSRVLIEQRGDPAVHAPSDRRRLGPEVPS